MKVNNASVWQDFDPNSEIILEGVVDNSFYVIITGDVMVRQREREVDGLPAAIVSAKWASSPDRNAPPQSSPPPSVTVMQVQSTLIERVSLNCRLRFHKVFLNTMVKRLSRTTEEDLRGEH